MGAGGDLFRRYADNATALGSLQFSTHSETVTANDVICAVGVIEKRRYSLLLNILL